MIIQRMAAFLTLLSLWSPALASDLIGQASVIDGDTLETSGGLYAWEFERDGRSVNVHVDGPFVLNDMHLLIDAALHGAGLATVMEDMAASFIADGRLVRVLEDWSPPGPEGLRQHPDVPRGHPHGSLACRPDRPGGLRPRTYRLRRHQRLSEIVAGDYEVVRAIALRIEFGQKVGMW
jgi:DNA-binding transcriptional LysR family regulator